MTFHLVPTEVLYVDSYQSDIWNSTAVTLAPLQRHNLLYYMPSLSLQSSYPLLLSKPTVTMSFAIHARSILSTLPFDCRSATSHTQVQTRTIFLLCGIQTYHI